MTKLLYIIMVMDENSIRNGLIWGEAIQVMNPC